MSGILMLQTALEHRRWAMDRLFSALSQLSDSEYFAESSVSHGSIHTILFHLLQVDQVWRILVAGQTPERLAPDDYPNLAALRRFWEHEDAALTALIAELSDDDLAATIQIRDWRGNLNTTRRFIPLMQLLMHGMQHRTELAQLLTTYGQSPGDLDFVFTPGAIVRVTSDEASV